MLYYIVCMYGVQTSPHHGHPNVVDCCGMESSALTSCHSEARSFSSFSCIQRSSYALTRLVALLSGRMLSSQRHEPMYLPRSWAGTFDKNDESMDQP